jgi:hypothetical protein
VKLLMWRSAQGTLAVLIALALLVGAMTPYQISLGYFFISGAGCIVTWRLRVGATVALSATGAGLLLVLAFTPPLINLALCTYPHICQTQNSVDAARALSLWLGLIWSVGLALAFGLTLGSRGQKSAEV